MKLIKYLVDYLLLLRIPVSIFCFLLEVLLTWISGDLFPLLTRSDKVPEKDMMALNRLYYSYIYTVKAPVNDLSLNSKPRWSLRSKNT